MTTFTGSVLAYRGQSVRIDVDVMVNDSTSTDARQLPVPVGPEGSQARSPAGAPRASATTEYPTATRIPGFVYE